MTIACPFHDQICWKIMLQPMRWKLDFCRSNKQAVSSTFCDFLVSLVRFTKQPFYKTARILVHSSGVPYPCERNCVRWGCLDFEIDIVRQKVKNKNPCSVPLTRSLIWLATNKYSGCPFDGVRRMRWSWGLLTELCFFGIVLLYWMLASNDCSFISSSPMSVRISFKWLSYLAVWIENFFLKRKKSLLVTKNAMKMQWKQLFYQIGNW